MRKARIAGAIAWPASKALRVSLRPWVPGLVPLRSTRPGHADIVSRTSERTDLGFTRDRHFKMRKSGKPDLRARAKIRDPAATPKAASLTKLRFATFCAGSRVSFRFAPLARDTPPRHP